MSSEFPPASERPPPEHTGPGRTASERSSRRAAFEDSEPHRSMPRGRAARLVWVACGWFALALGVLGAFLPVIPTTPLVLVAAWCFSKGSERLHRRLLEHRRFGPLVRDWERHRVIRLRAKLLATAVIVPLTAWMLLFTPVPRWTKALTTALVLWGLVFIWTKPSTPSSIGDTDGA